MTTALEYNIKVHNKIAKKYEQTHGEIYNTVEQDRLKEALKNALSCVETGNQHPLVLDFGCGAGNLTRHLTNMGCKVIAGDVSPEFLNLVASRTYAMPVTTVRLNGINLSNIPDESVDMVTMYSVLHHVPDYLGLTKEFSRVLKKGGVIFIDHEASDLMWNKNETYLQFLSEIKKTSTLDLKKYYKVSNYVDRIIRIFVNPKYQSEGDIHVFPDDHIEWGEIRTQLENSGVNCFYEKDYLLFRRSYNQKTYDAYKEKIGDMHVLLGRKR